MLINLLEAANVIKAASRRFASHGARGRQQHQRQQQQQQPQKMGIFGRRQIGSDVRTLLEKMRISERRFSWVGNTFPAAADQICTRSVGRSGGSLSWPWSPRARCTRRMPACDKAQSKRLFCCRRPFPSEGGSTGGHDNDQLRLKCTAGQYRQRSQSCRIMI